MIPAWLGATDDRGPCPVGGARAETGFAERTLLAVARLVAEGAAADPGATTRGLGGFDPRAKLIGSAMILIAIAATPSLGALAAAAVLAPALAAGSRVGVGRFVRDVWVFVPLFTAAIAIPALFRSFTPGETLVEVGPLAITRPGALAAARLVLRAGASASTAMLLARTTGAAPLLRALRAVGVPQAIALVAAMTYRYIFLLAREVEEMHLGLLSRRLSPLRTRAGRAFVTSRMAVLLAKANRTAEDVHLAMVARGFRGEVRTLAAPRLQARDAALVVAAAALAAAMMIPRMLGAT